MSEFISTQEAVKAIWIAQNLPEAFLKNLIVTKRNPDLEVPSSFRLGVAAQAAVALSGLAAAYLHFLRTGEEQTVTVDARHAALTFHSEAWYTLDGQPPPPAWDNIAGLYMTKDKKWARVHTNFPHHRSAVLSVLSLPDTPAITKEDVASAFSTIDALEFEQKCLNSTLPICAVIMRTREEWIETEQGKALLEEYRQMGAGGPVEIRKISESPPKGPDTIATSAESRHPLDGIRVLDLSRVLAGPVAGRTLAAHGAQTLLVTSPKLPALPALDVETSLGKRTTQLDLTEENDRSILRQLVENADVFLQAYRPQALEKMGFGSNDVLQIKSSRNDRRSVVYAQLCAWGWTGPWKGRRGFDSLVQTATGLNADEGLSFMQSKGLGVDGQQSLAPRPFPMQALDHAAGYFLAFGICAALCHQITGGGSYEVRVSLAGVAEWVRSLGRVSPREAFKDAKAFPNREDAEISALSVDWYGRSATSLRQESDVDSLDTSKAKRKMTAIRHAAVLSKTPVKEGVVKNEGDGTWGAPLRLNADDPVWI